MNPISTTRRLTRPIVAVLAAAAVLVTLVVAIPDRPANAAGTTTSSSPRHGHDDLRPPRNAAQVAFHDQMRKLWEDHITWTRLAIVTFADGSAGFDATAARLLQNQVDIGNAIKPFFGNAAGNQLTALLREHILIAVEILQAVKAGDTDAFNDASDRWYANANDIADFLSAANPRSWPRAELRAAMKTHLDQTLAEAAHELGGDYVASVADYEEIHLHILDLADLLSSGIIRRFPHKFH
jgi:hypothetical protein